MLFLPLFLALFFTPYQCLGLPLSIPGLSLISDKIDFPGRSDAANAVDGNPSQVSSLRIEPLRQTISDLLAEAGKRVQDLRSKARCVQIGAAEAGQQASDGLSEAASCSLTAVQTASSRINRIADQLQKNIFTLANVAKQFVKDVVNCSSAPDIRECDRQALLVAETAVSEVSENIQARLGEAATVWKRLVEDLRLCSIAGAEDVSDAQSNFLQRILKCIS